MSALVVANAGIGALDSCALGSCVLRRAVESVVLGPRRNPASQLDILCLAIAGRHASPPAASGAGPPGTPGGKDPASKGVPSP